MTSDTVEPARSTVEASKNWTSKLVPYASIPTDVRYVYSGTHSRDARWAEMAASAHRIGRIQRGTHGGGSSPSRIVEASRQG